MRVVGPRKSKKMQKTRNSPGGVRTHGIRITQMCVIQVTFVNYIRTDALLAQVVGSRGRLELTGALPLRHRT
jgi:hypothetical protein